VLIYPGEISLCTNTSSLTVPASFLILWKEVGIRELLLSVLHTLPSSSYMIKHRGL
jgi:hypothetical protein